LSDTPQPSQPFTQRALKWAVFLGAAALVVYLCLRILSPFVNVIAWSAVLAITFHPVHGYLVRRTGRPTLSALLSSALVVVAFVIPLSFIAGLAINQFLQLGESLQDAFTADAGIDTTTPFGRAYEWITGWLGFDTQVIVVWVQQNASELARVGAQYTVAIAAGVTGAVVSFVFIIFAMFLLFRDGERIVARIPELLPFERSRSEALLARIRDVIFGGVYGVIVIALIQGALCGGMFWVLGIPSAALWGMVTVLTSVIPLVGAAGVWVPGTIYLLLGGQYVKAIVLVVWGTLAVSGIDNFLRPRLVGGKVGLSELVMFFALLGGLQAFGVLGIVLGPVVFAIAGSIVQVLSDRESVPATDPIPEPEVAIPEPEVAPAADDAAGPA
jgi:predicted PurR-regulated permease PerM